MVSITALHHLPLAPALRKIGGTLRPGGKPLVLDLHKAQSAADYPVGALGFPASRAVRLAETGALSGNQSLELGRA